VAGARVPIARRAGGHRRRQAPRVDGHPQRGPGRRAAQAGAEGRGPGGHPQLPGWHAGAGMSVSWRAEWFEAEGAIAPRQTLAWRGVEAQHVVSTMRLVDHPDEQALLEQLLDDSKPALPRAARGLHYLLSTPFRYAPVHA